VLSWTGDGGASGMLTGGGLPMLLGGRPTLDV
jgi:hypothetical protein